MYFEKCQIFSQFVKNYSFFLISNLKRNIKIKKRENKNNGKNEKQDKSKRKPVKKTYRKCTERKSVVEKEEDKC